jgi:hypothetical protein
MWRLRTGDIAWREVEEEVVVLDLRSSQYLTLNGTGAFLWAMLDRGASAEALTEGLAGEWEVDRATAAQDVEVFLRQCQEADLIEAVAA